jgi:hypothetical protein
MESEAKIQQYLLLGKGAKGRAAVDLIHKATSEPGLYAFGEVLDLESIKQVCTTRHCCWSRCNVSQQQHCTVATRHRPCAVLPAFEDLRIWHLGRLQRSVGSFVAKH